MVVLEMDETPAFGTETVVKAGVEGVVECKKQITYFFKYL